MTALRTAAVCVIVLLSMRPGSDGAGQAGLLKTVWQPVCGLSEELDVVGGNSLRIIDDILSAATNQTNTAIRLRIYALKNIEEKPVKEISALASYYAARGHAAIMDMQATELAKHIAAVRSATYLKGRIDEGINMLEQVKGGQNGCLVATAADDTTEVRTGTRIGGVECKLKLSELSKTTWSKANIDETGYPNLKEGGTTSGTAVQPTDSNNVCRLLHHSSAHGLGNSANLDTAVKSLAGYITTGATAAPTLAARASLTTTKTSATGAWVDAYERAGKYRPKLNTEYSSDTSPLDKRPDLVKAVRSTETKLEGEGEEPAAKLVTAYFGGTEPNKLDAFLKLVEQDKIPKGIAGLQKDTFIGQITNTEQLNQILSYYVYHASLNYNALQKKLDEATKKKDTKAAEDTCNKIKDETACSNKPFCTYNTTETDENKKCKFDETKAKSKVNGVPVTQTQDGGAITVNCGQHADKTKCEEKTREKQPLFVYGEKAKRVNLIKIKKCAEMVVSSIKNLL
ncbi:variant surface glycoprotein (VSG), putative [Trypanosoma brucei brucei TREU927]|uniref:Variant surface glycoprotein (VSG), putative n=1 Tax=Trypanosoma brucei brucei (strain 927/4 GUTat10.1) TaxID=185431 RepID=Q387P1_TRYB2|nr:variant surface glycoprotein (VSG), putative [Trypanosoma brucei brucei TREU927]EAN78981.1 variant surface glycoprotein (VSG), putative [Trypanosoma brucei brucei TREU927]